MRGSLFLIVAALAAIALPAPAAVLTVDWNGTGDYETIQPAIDAAGEGDTVLVYPGTYTGDGNRDLAFGAKNIVLRGRNGRDETFIDCQNQPSHHGIYLNNTGQDTTCVIEGLTIEYAQNAAPGDPGGGVRLRGSSPKIIDCRIRYCVVNGGAGGGGIYCLAASPVLVNVEIIQNWASYGAGLHCGEGYLAGHRAPSSPTLRNVTIRGNHSDVGANCRGGGIYCSFGCNPTLIDVHIEGNDANEEGGGIYCFKASPSLSRVTFLDNSADVKGGALSLSINCSPTIAGCTFSGNAAPDGAGIFMTNGCSPPVTNTIIAFSDDGAGVLCDGVASPTFTYCCSFANEGGDDLCGSARSPALNFIGDHDPLFCDISENDITLAGDSPCLPGGNTWGEHIGALDQGCVQSPVVNTTWGSIKAMYR